MNMAVWTLWLIVHAAGGGATPVVTPMATFATSDDCTQSIAKTSTVLEKGYGKNAPVPGLWLCVYGIPVKR